MIAVFAIAPALQSGTFDEDTARQAAFAVGRAIVAIALFASACWAFARHLEPKLARWLQRLDEPTSRTVVILGIGLSVAAIAGALGFSVAVGALFAGLMFSVDRRVVQETRRLGPVYAFFTPFFFIHAGYGLDLRRIGPALGLGLALLAPAILGKVLGGYLPTRKQLGERTAWQIGVSLVPRAEIALLVAQMGSALGPSAMPPRAYGALVLVSAATATFGPIVLARLLPATPPSR